MPDDGAVIDQLRRYADAAEGAVADVRPLAPRARRRPYPWLAVVAAAVVAIVAGAVALTGKGDDADDVAAGGSTVASPGWSTFPAAPIGPRIGAVATMADGELLVWGGRGDDGALADGAAWSVADGSWRVLAPAPIGPRSGAVGAWTGDEWLVLGGVDDDSAPRLDGAAYDPGTDAWRVTAPPPLPVVSGTTGAAWTGTELVVVGATEAAAYDPVADAWRVIPVDDGPADRLAIARGVAAAWSGSEVLIVAIIDGRNVVVDSVDPATGAWGGGYPTPASGLDTGEDGVVWTGAELLVIGHYATGARFDPATGLVDALVPSESQARFPAVVVGHAVTVGDRWLDFDTMAWQDAEPFPEPRREFPVAAGDDTAAYWWGGSGCGPGASCVRLVDPGVGLRWVPPARAPESTTTSTLATTEAAIGQGSWRGARTGFDGQSLVVAFVGGAPYEPGVPCTVDYAMTAEEDAAEVRIRIVQVAHPPPTSIATACAAAGFSRIVETQLAAPLGDRRVVDAQLGVERPVFDGRRLAQPPELPPGWRLQDEQSGYTDPVAAPSWHRRWAPDRPVDNERCSGSPAGIAVVQGDPTLLDAYIDGSGVVGTYDVRGNEATARESAHRRDLSWVEAGQGFFLISELGCDVDTLASVDELVAFARGPHRPGRVMLGGA